MRELPTSVFEKESAIDRECCGEEIYKEDHKEEDNRSPVLVDENGLVRNEEFQFAHEPEREREQNSDSQDESVAYHLNAWSSRK
jgi:hypothetical protein